MVVDGPADLGMHMDEDLIFGENVIAENDVCSRIEEKHEADDQVQRVRKVRFSHQALCYLS